MGKPVKCVYMPEDIYCFLCNNQKSRKSRKKNNGVKRRLVPPPDTPMSATPTCIPPEAPAPIFPNSHGVNSEQDSGKMKTGFLEMERLNQTKLEL